MFSYQLNPQEVNNEFALLNKVGTVKAFAGSTPPSGWLFCDGSQISRTTYAALFAAIGTTYGAGDGSTTFNLPNIVIAGGNIESGVVGNGKGLGLTDGTNTRDLKLVYIGASSVHYTVFGGGLNTNQNIGTLGSYGNFNTDGVTAGGDARTLGVAISADYSGLKGVGNINNAAQKARAIIKY